MYNKGAYFRQSFIWHNNNTYYHRVCPKENTNGTFTLV